MEKLQMPRFAENFVMSTVGPEKPQWLDFRYNSIQWYFPAIFSSNLAQAGDETTQYDSLRNIFSIRIGYFRICPAIRSRPWYLQDGHFLLRLQSKHSRVVDDGLEGELVLDEFPRAGDVFLPARHLWRAARVAGRD
jgi:hypothetical protein